MSCVRFAVIAASQAWMATCAAEPTPPRYSLLQIEVAMSPKPLPSVVLFVADVPELSAFYRELASMAVVHEDSDHAVLELDGFQLVIHRLSGEPAPTRTPNGQVRVREDSYVKFCLPVSSIADARSRATTLGGFIKPPEREWQARGFRACDGYDLEGNVFQIRESAT
jgi:hypothetical protein